MSAFVDRSAALLVKEGLSRHTKLRGRCASDGRMTLLTVNWHTTAQALRLIRSFSSFVDGDAAVVAVDNSPSRANRAAFGRLGARYVTTGANLGHGLGLDFGMRFVETEFVLVCDPDTAVVSPAFARAVRSRLELWGIASVDSGNPFYHPLCVAFRSEHWKRGGFSFLQRWPYWDTGGELTHLMGGVEPQALIPRTRSAGAPLKSAFGGDGEHFLGELHGDCFTNTYLTARLVAEPDRDDFDGWSRSAATEFHRSWNAWVEGILDGTATLEGFPAS